MRPESGKILAVVGSLVAVVPAAAPLGAQQLIVGGVQVRNESDSGGAARPMPLVNSDEEMGSYLRHAQEMLSSKQYAEAIEILHALLSRTDPCFVPTSDPRRYVSLAFVASRVLGQLPPEGMKLYRRLYDPQAEQLFRRARAGPDESALWDLRRRFLHSSYGDDALDLLGALLFDRGQFSQAGRCWREVLEVWHQTDLDRAVILAKVAVAYHYAGERTRAREALKRLERDFGHAEAVLEGRKQNVVTFVRKVLSRPAPAFARARESSGDWTSLAGSADSVAQMAPSQVVLDPRWTRPGGNLASNLNLQAVFGLIRRSTLRYGPGRSLPKPRLTLREGRVVAVTRVGRTFQSVVLPAMVHPVVVGTTVMYRTAEGIVARDLLTGELLWKTFGFPLYRTVMTPRVVTYYNTLSPALIKDDGRMTLTVGGGMVFAVGRFPPRTPPRYVSPPALRSRRQEPNDSVLEAFSLAGEGKRVWRIGRGEGGDDLLRACCYLGAPTYAEGRLYALAAYMQAYHLLCLDPENGQLLWKALVAQKPVSARRFYSFGGIQGEVASPPAVAEGRVFVVTNAGVVAAFEAESGQALWAYQYDSNVNRLQGPTHPRIPHSQGGEQVSVGYPGNPIIVARGRAICLPADSEQLLSLRTDTGELLWSASRERQRDLTAVGETRVLLSGPGLRLVDAASGRGLWQAPAGVGGVLGRPAVTSEAILAAGRGKIFRVSLSDYSVVDRPLVDPRGILGNLVSVRGKLLASNLAGVSAYFAYSDARRELTQRIARAKPEETPELLYQRGMIAFNADRPAEAVTDLLAAREAARRRNDTGLLSRTGQGLYRAYVSLANRSSDRARMRGLFEKALTLAYSDRSRGEMIIRLVKYYREVGDYARAVELAQRLTTEFAEVDLADVDIGPMADHYVRDDADTPRASGYVLGHRYIGEMIRRHGQRCYAVFDAKAKAALSAAVAADDPEAMVRVADEYRHSTWAPMALLRAAESHFRRAESAAGDDRREALSLAGRCLSRIRRDYPDSGLGPSAQVGMALVYQRMNPRVVWLALRGLDEVPPRTRVSFAGVSGPLEAVLKRLRLSPRRPVRPAAAPPVHLDPPLTKLYAAGEPMFVVRGLDGAPLHAGRSVFLLRQAHLVRFDPSARDFQAGVRWETPLPVNAARLYQFGYAGPGYSLAAGLTRDGKTLALGSRGGIVGVDVGSGKVLWKRGQGESLVAGLSCMTIGADRFVVLSRSGGIHVLDMRTGKELWRHGLGQQQMPWRAAPQVAGGLLLTVQGRRRWEASVFDMAGRKLLGTVPLGQGLSQVRLSPDGLLVTCDGSRLRLIEPVLGIDRELWSVRLPASVRPAVVGLTGAYIILSPSMHSGVVELRGLSDYGRIVRTFQTASVGGQPAVPFAADIQDGRLYVLAGAPGAVNRMVALSGRLRYTRMPSLHAFDVRTGRRLWTRDLTPAGRANAAHVVLLTPAGPRHLCVLVREPSYTRPTRVMILDRADGSVVQEIVLPGLIRAGKISLMVRYMLLFGPVVTDGRLLLEARKGLEVYGNKPQ